MRFSAQDWEPLLGTPHEKLDCRALVLETYRRARAPLPPGALSGPPVASGGGWVLVGHRAADATRPLDVVASDPMRTGSETHLSVRVPGAGSERLVLTSNEHSGVIAEPPDAVVGVVAVYRRAEP